MSDIHIREASKADFQFIVELNEKEVVWTSAMDLSSLEELNKVASYHKVAECNGKVVGFLLAVGSEKRFINENFAWFANVYPTFIYIDRIVVDESSKGMGIGRILYENLFGFARARGVPVIGCEFNLRPVNKASKLFHSKLLVSQ